MIPQGIPIFLALQPVDPVHLNVRVPECRTRPEMHTKIVCN